MQRSRARLGGWTLIELLVVIGIIGILAALFMPSAFSIYDRAKKAQAKNDLTQIVNAVNAYYTEYGKYPIVTADTIYGPAGTSSADLFYTLRAVNAGTANANNAANPRIVVFISPRVYTTATARSGIASDGQFYDPWGTPYNIEIDGDYDNKITNPYAGDTGAGVNPLPFGVIGWSYGKDRTKGTKSPASPNYTGSDDVISWQ